MNSLKKYSRIIGCLLCLFLVIMIHLSERAYAQEEYYSYITEEINTHKTSNARIELADFKIPKSESDKILQYYTDLCRENADYYWIEDVGINCGDEIINSMYLSVKQKYFDRVGNIDKEHAKEDFLELQARIEKGEWREIVKEKVVDPNNIVSSGAIAFTLYELIGTVSDEDIAVYLGKLLSEPDYYYIDEMYQNGYYFYMYYSSGYTEESFKLNKLKEYIALESVYGHVISSNMSDIEKVLAIHEFVVRECEYDYQNYLDDTIPEVSYSRYGLFNNGLAVCSGYTEAMQYFLEREGIKQSYIRSSNMNHAWNVVCVDGKYYHVDATWDDAGKDDSGEGQAYHKFFLKSDGEFSEHHCCWNYDGESGESGSYSNYIFRQNETSYITYNYYDGFWYYKDGYYSISKSKIDGTQKNVFKSFDETIINAYIYQKYMYVATDKKVYKIDMRNTSNVTVIYDIDNDNIGAYISEFVIKQGKIKIDSGENSKYIAITNNSSISLNTSNANMTEGDTLKLTATYSSDFGSNVLWASTEPQIVSVDSSGKLTAKGEGTATIVAAVDGKIATCKVVSKGKCEVRFNVNGGNALTSKKMNVIVGDTIDTMPVPTKEGYEFVGWYKEKEYYIEYSTKVDENTTINSDITLYARWEMIPHKVSGFTYSDRTSNTITLKWNQNTSADRYEIWQYGNGKWTNIKELTSYMVSYTVTGLDASTSYQFMIVPYRMVWEGKVYGGSVTKTVKTLPSKVSGFTYNACTSNSVSLKWTKNASADGYEIWQYKSGSWTKIKTITNKTTISYKVNNLKSSVNYNFKIRAYKNDGNIKLYGNYSTKSVKTLPSYTKGFTFKSRTASTITLKWTKNTSADGYVIQQYKGGKWTTIKTITKNSTVSYKVTGLKPSTSYKFRIKAYKKDGGSKLYGTYSTKTVKTVPSTVKSFTYKSRTAKTITLKWTKNTSADGYVIQQYKGGKWTTIKTIASKATVNYKVAGLKKNTTYKFRIKAYKKSGSTKLYSAYATKSIKTLK